eukprot:s898_g10.t1
MACARILACYLICAPLWVVLHEFAQHEVTHCQFTSALPLRSSFTSWEAGTRGGQYEKELRAPTQYFSIQQVNVPLHPVLAQSFAEMRSATGCIYTKN